MRTVSWVNNKVVLIDQTKLPFKFELIETDDITRIATAIKRLEVRGAPAIGVTAAYAMALAALQSKNKDPEKVLIELKNTRDFLATARPTATNLFWAIDHMYNFAREIVATGNRNLGELLLEEAERLADEDVNRNQRLAEFGEQLLPDGARVLTHCNCGPLCSVDIGSATAPMILAHQKGKKVHVYTDETRPRLQGAKINVWELNNAGVPYTLITDNTAAFIMQKGLVDFVFIGVDRAVANGDLAAKIGVYGLSVLAKYHNIPFYAVSQIPTFDMDTPDGEHITVEERDPDEVRKINDQLITIPNAEVLNYAFDITPHENITGYITDKGIIYPPFDENIKRIINQ